MTYLKFFKNVKSVVYRYLCFENSSPVPPYFFSFLKSEYTDRDLAEV